MSVTANKINYEELARIILTNNSKAFTLESLSQQLGNDLNDLKKMMNFLKENGVIFQQGSMYYLNK